MDILSIQGITPGWCKPAPIVNDYRWCVIVQEVYNAGQVVRSAYNPEVTQSIYNPGAVQTQADC